MLLGCVVFQQQILAAIELFEALGVWILGVMGRNWALVKPQKAGIADS
jgi:hypothetical protein